MSYGISEHRSYARWDVPSEVNYMCSDESAANFSGMSDVAGAIVARRVYGRCLRA
jgi:hypothetical protein